MFVSQCTDELIWLNEREEEEIAYDWSDNNTNTNAKKELYSVSVRKRRDAYMDGFLRHKLQTFNLTWFPHVFKVKIKVLFTSQHIKSNFALDCLSSPLTFPASCSACRK